MFEAAPERGLWGADFPHPNVKWMLNGAEFVDLFVTFCDEVLRRRILVDNPNRLYWSGGKHA
ncbi:MAG TPA: amidohydrolase family protein [Candidatus Binatia bacterium]